MILQCPFCRRVRMWERASEEDGPGKCACGRNRSWNVLPKIPAPQAPGFVRVYSDKGSQELHGPNWQENPNAWKKP